MIVTAGAAHTQGQHRARRDIDHLVGDVHIELLWVGLVEIVGSQRKEPGRDLLLDALLVAVVRKQIPSDLFLHEAVKGLVAVEGLDDVVAIAPRHRERQVTRATDRVGVPHHVQPVPPPALAEAIRFE